MDKLTSLREKHPTFLYERFSYQKENNNLIITFSFKISSDIEFHPKIKIENISNDNFSRVDPTVLNNFIFNLGLVEMISYWKATCSPQIEIRSGQLNEEQVNWWQNLLQKGLGEFFFQNKINFKQKSFVTIKSSSREIYQKDTNAHKDRFLVLNSGGRDSVVSIETLKNLEKEISLLMLNPMQAAIEVAEQSGVTTQIIVKREMDKRLFELNGKGYLNGHTPFSAYLAFLSVFCASIFDYRFTVASNERSSNEGNVKFLGDNINHQYSKSFEFEKSFREYSNKYLAQDIIYFSLLRPIYELQISKLFSKYKKYFTNFRSCNVGQKQGIWCGKCPKCLSLFISMFPFLEEGDIKSIFNKNIYEDKDLEDLLLYLTGEKQPKPFDCVGTYEEVIEGLRLSIQKLEKEIKPLPYLLKFSEENVLSRSQTKSKILTAWDESHFLTEEIAQNLKEQVL